MDWDAVKTSFADSGASCLVWREEGAPPRRSGASAPPVAAGAAGFFRGDCVADKISPGRRPAAGLRPRPGTEVYAETLGDRAGGDWRGAGSPLRLRRAGSRHPQQGKYRLPHGTTGTKNRLAGEAYARFCPLRCFPVVNVFRSASPRQERVLSRSRYLLMRIRPGAHRLYTARPAFIC